MKNTKLKENFKNQIKYFSWPSLSSSFFKLKNNENNKERHKNEKKCKKKRDKKIKKESKKEKHEDKKQKKKNLGAQQWSC